MIPTIEEGDILVINLDETDPNFTGVYAVKFPGLNKPPYIFRLQPLNDGRIRLISDNEKYKDMVKNTDDFVIYGRLAYVLRRFRS